MPRLKPPPADAAPFSPGRKAALSFPWLILLFVAFLVWLDGRKTGTMRVIDSAAMEATSGPAAEPAHSAATAVDPICGMEIATKTAHKARFGGKTYYFCSTYCVDEFAKDPANSASSEVRKGWHTMRGIPTPMYQVMVALIIILSFGIFDLTARGRSPLAQSPERLSAEGAARGSSPLAQSPERLSAEGTARFGNPKRSPMSARFDLTSLPGVRAVLKWPPLVFVLRSFVAASFLLIIAAGLFGDQNPAMNIAPLLTWTVWWAGLIFIILFLGKSWCTICPWDALATWIERLKFWGPRGEGTGLNFRWPPALRNIWAAVILFLLLTWVEIGLGVTLVPRATALIALGMLGLAIASVLVFDRKAFCRYGCLVGRISGLYAMFAPLEVRSKDDSVCASCRTMDCYRGNDKGDGCPTFEFPRAMNQNTYCILCTECFKTCPHDNMALRLRPWGADFTVEGKPRTDEAFLALILLSMTGFHGLTMTPVWRDWTAAFEAATGLPYGASFSVLMTGILLAPIAVYAALIWTATFFGGKHGFRTLFIHYAYPMLPIALFYHLAHNAEHFLMEGPKLIALFSDPFGWGWNLFGTAAFKAVPAITLEGLWWIQIVFILIGHIYGLWISDKTTRRLIPENRAAFLSQLPMLAAMVAFSVFSLWLLKQPMEMRVSAM